jgi:sRNA-binding protein
MSTTERVDTAAIITRLAELCPARIFVWEKRRRPLQVGIREAISARVGDAIAPDELNIAMRAYVRSIGYLTAVARGDKRIDLEGNPAGETTLEQRAGAGKAVAAHWARVAARKAAARSSSETPVPVAELPAPVPETPAGPKRLGLADLKQHALARKAAVQ